MVVNSSNNSRFTYSEQFHGNFSIRGAKHTDSDWSKRENYVGIRKKRHEHPFHKLITGFIHIACRTIFDGIYTHFHYRNVVSWNGVDSLMVFFFAFYCVCFVSWCVVVGVISLFIEISFAIFFLRSFWLDVD